jgi:chromosomal replication initiation ATPase DnaA
MKDLADSPAKAVRLTGEDMARCREIVGTGSAVVLSIADLVSEETGIRLAEIYGHSRVPKVVMARQLVMYICYERHGLSYPAIGHALNRDHSTVLHGVRAERIRRGEA